MAKVSPKKKKTEKRRRHVHTGISIAGLVEPSFWKSRQVSWSQGKQGKFFSFGILFECCHLKLFIDSKKLEEKEE